MHKKEKTLLIGPYPPPYHGTSIPFKLFCDYLNNNLLSSDELCLLNTQTGDKALISIFNPKTSLKLVGLIWRILWRSLSKKKIIVFGSQRFVTTIGLILLIFKPFGKEIHLRINGGAYDKYLEQQPIFLRKIIIKGLSQFSSVVVETSLVASKLKNLGVKRLKVCPNYRVLPKKQNKFNKKKAQNKIFFLYTGVVRRSKGCLELVQAFLDLKRWLNTNKHNYDLTLNIYGPIYDTKIIEYFPDIEQKGVFFHGNIDPHLLKKAYEEADIFVFPSYWKTEGHSGAVIEAMSYGLPVIATSWRANSELIQNKVNGLLCKPRDVTSLFECMKLLVLDKKMREKLGNAALDFSKKFDAKVICKDLASNFKLISFKKQ